MSRLGARATKGMMWSAVEKFSTSGVSFVFNILIARILLPSDYGLIAMLGIFISVCTCFIDSGFSTALIRKIDRNESDYSTVFFSNMGLSVICYAVLFFTAPLIAKLYNAPALTGIARVIGISLIIGSISSIQNVKLTIDINLRARAVVSVVSALISGVVGLILARSGWGVMALVWQTITLSTAKALMLFVMIRWTPSVGFSSKSFRNLFGFGSKMLMSNLIYTIYDNAYTMVIGKFFSPVSLGYYAKADNIAQFPSSGMSHVFHSVAFPVLSQVQENRLLLKSHLRRFIRLSAFIVFPMMAGLAGVADPFIRLALTDKWAGSVIFLQLLCAAYLPVPVNKISMCVLNVVGRSDLYLRVEILRKIVGIAILCITIPFGIMTMCVGLIVSNVISTVIITIFTEKTVNYSLGNHLKDMYKSLLCSLLMAVLIGEVTSLIGPPAVSLCVGIVLGVAAFITFAFIFRCSELSEFKSIATNYLIPNRNRQ